MHKTSSKNNMDKEGEVMGFEMIHSPPEIIVSKIEQLAKTICVDASEILLWLGPYLQLPTSTLMGFLHLAINHRLDPLMGELVFWLDTQNQAHPQAHPSITIDGWMKIINQHPQFMGIEFEETSSLDNKDLHSMKCTIYRKDRSLPICIEEHLVEVKNDHPLWKSMPRRMLRHRSLQQCARLAFGISTPEFVNTEEQVRQENIPKTQTVHQSLDHTQEAVKVSRTELLKERLTESSLGSKNIVAFSEESPKI